MTALVCPHCGTSLAGVTSPPDEAVVCPKCAKVVPRVEESGSAAAASPIKSVEKPKSPWSTGPVKDVKTPWSVNPTESKEEPWSEESLDGEIALPFDPREELALESPVGSGRPAVLWAFTALAVFLLMLIGAVLLARHLRPLIAGHAVDPAALQPCISQLKVGTDESRQEAAAAIVAMGPDSLIAALDQITTEDRGNDKFLIVPGAVRALAGAGDDAIDALSEALRSPKPNVRVGAASVLREMGARGRNALGPLMVALQDENRWVRCSAIESLGNLGSEAEGAITVLVGLAGHPEAYTRRRAIDALGHIGPAAKEAVPTLTKAMELDSDASVRRAAYVALQQIRLPEIAEDSLAQADKEVRAIVTVLQADDDFAAIAAAKTLGDMSIQAKSAIPALALMLRHKDKWRREAAAKALGNLGLFANDFVPTLQVAAKDLEPEVRAAAEKAIEEIEGKQLRR